MNISVFLSDDHAMFRQGVRLLLEGEKNISVIGEASNGRSAVREVVERKPNVVVMDILLPEMNGIDATEAICERSPTTKVIILTTKSSNDHIFRAFKAGASAYVLKKLGGEELIRAINAVHSGKRFLCDIVGGVIIDDYIMHREKGTRADILSRLTRREREIMQLLSEGKSNKEVADILFLSQSTVGSHRHRIMNKLMLDNYSDLIRFAIKHGIIGPD